MVVNISRCGFSTRMSSLALEAVSIHQGGGGALRDGHPTQALLNQRASPALFGAEDLLFRQVELTHHEVALPHHVRRTGVGHVISRELESPVFCWRQQVDALGIVQRDFVEVHDFPPLLGLRLVYTRSRTRPW